METGRQRRLSAAAAWGFAVAGLAAGFLAGACDARGGGRGAVRLALEASSCEAHCVVSVQAQPFRSRDDALGIGPPSDPTACGEPVVLGDLPVGLRVTVKAWASDGLDNRFVGWSEPVTVTAGEAVTATAQLQATSPPRILSVTPEPVVLPDPSAAQGAGEGGDGQEPVAILLTGEGFAQGAGTAYVDAGGQALPGESWSDEAVTASVQGPISTAQVRVVACGAASAPVPLRVLPVTPGRRAVAVGACPQAAVVAVGARSGGQAAAALACSDGTAGALLPLTLGPGACAMGISAWPLPGPPSALALDAQRGAWVAVGDAVTRYDLDTGAPSAAGETPGEVLLAASVQGPVVRLALWQTWLLALAAGEDGGATLVGVDLAVTGDARLQPVPGVGAGLRLRDLAPTAEEVLVVAAPAQGAGAGATGRLARLRDPAQGFPEEWPLPDCAEPVAVAASPDSTASAGWAAVACAGSTPGVVAVPLGGAPADARHVALALAPGQIPTGVRLDAAATVAFVAASGDDGTTVTAVDLRVAAPLRTWVVTDAPAATSASASPDGPAAGPLLAAFGAPDRLILGAIAALSNGDGDGDAGTDASTLTVLAPYDDADPCAPVLEAP